MKAYVVSYYLGNMFHCYTVEAENEVDAMLRALNRIPETSRALFHDFRITQTERAWN